MKRTKLGSTALLAFLATCAAHAQSTNYTYQLVLRSGDAGGYNLGGAFSFSSSTASLNDNGQVAIKALSATGDWGVWTGSATNGSGVWANANSGSGSLSDASIDNSGRVVFGKNDSSGVFKLQAGSTVISQLTTGPSGATSWGSFRALDNGLVGMKTNNNTNSYVLFNPATNSFSFPVTENGNYSFLFSSVQFNQSGQMAAPVQPLSSTAREMRLWSSTGVSTLIAQDRSLNPSSTFTSFFNNIGLSNNGWVAFNAALFGGGRGIYLSNGSTTREIANTNNSAQDWGTGESFNMGVTDGGQVYFRGRDRAGKYALYVGDGTSLTKVVTQGDTLMTDLGPAMVKWPGDTSPVFSGSPTMNSLGQVVFTASLVNPNNTTQQYGLGVFTATPVPEPATLTVIGLASLVALRRRRKA